jgi:hypothetical protein
VKDIGKNFSKWARSYFARSDKKLRAIPQFLQWADCADLELKAELEVQGSGLQGLVHFGQEPDRPGQVGLQAPGV